MFFFTFSRKGKDTVLNQGQFFPPGPAPTVPDRAVLQTYASQPLNPPKEGPLIGAGALDGQHKHLICEEGGLDDLAWLVLGHNHRTVYLPMRLAFVLMHRCTHFPLGLNFSNITAAAIRLWGDRSYNKSYPHSIPLIGFQVPDGQTATPKQAGSPCEIYRQQSQISQQPTWQNLPQEFLGDQHAYVLFLDFGKTHLPLFEGHAADGDLEQETNDITPQFPPVIASLTPQLPCSGTQTAWIIPFRGMGWWPAEAGFQTIINGGFQAFSTSKPLSSSKQ
ncbi:hypothetical protein BO82DRAFT_360181 [Aspergillus uvarum CBS 121591]|uniref:Uncharacterized protein n=1 Tax=Aspergillus uvarum CBS 121591 TaxID=1448315 RepID=A0A319CNQ9_9EURO|nr:hypothetical protein BO82DRAFT_360181 [Aspergillus uvarum CBS 121591]PYH87065.1 hypothetical protein BO82DRAFT_360181 [Aspergillus uvarum CBS 121591]